MQRENIISCNINYRGGSSLYIDGSGDTGLRMEKDHAGYNLFLNSAWDYTSLLWGNYDRRSYLTGTLSDKISFTINKTQ